MHFIHCVRGIVVLQMKFEISNVFYSNDFIIDEMSIFDNEGCDWLRSPVAL